MNTSTLLDLHDLGFAYAGQAPLASGWTTRIGAGVTLLHGDTGSGKSTLLRVLAGALPATGRLTLAGRRLDADPDAYRRNVFLCEPATDGFDQVTARACTASLSVGDAAFDAAAWQTLVDGFALAPHLDKPLYMLSTGSKRKVWLAAALASGRALTLLDEPTGGLDAASIRCLWDALARLADRADRAVIVASAERIDRVPLAATIELPLC
ncbi:MAG: ATP-binding cassette domain-containing protein [Pseudomonadota bacterium]